MTQAAAAATTPIPAIGVIEPSIDHMQRAKLALEIEKLKADIGAGKRSAWHQPALYVSVISALAALLTTTAVLIDKRAEAEVKNQQIAEADRKLVEAESKLAVAKDKARDAELSKQTALMQVGALKTERDQLAEETRGLTSRTRNAKRNYEAFVRGMAATMVGSLGKPGFPRVSVPIRVENTSTRHVYAILDAGRELVDIPAESERVLIEARVFDKVTVRIKDVASDRQLAVLELPSRIDAGVWLVRYDGDALQVVDNPDSPQLTMVELVGLIQQAGKDRQRGPFKLPSPNDPGSTHAR